MSILNKLIIFLSCIALIYLMNFGYYRGELYYYDLVNRGEEESYLYSLLKFDLNVLFFNLIFLISSCFYFFKVRGVGFYDAIFFIFVFALNVTDSLFFLVKNFIRNHYDIFELNVFVVLLEKYGAIINLIYMAPAVISIIFTVFFVFFIRKRFK